MQTARDVADVLEEIETLLLLHGAEEFRARAYGRAARLLETSTLEVGEIVPAVRRGELRGIGGGLAEEIEEIVVAGVSRQLEDLLAGTPPGLLDIMTIRGLGPKKVRALWTGLGIESLEQLEAAARAGQIAGAPGFGAKSQENILAGIEELRRRAGRLRIDAATELGERLLARLESIGNCSVRATGLLRRGAEEYDRLEFLAVGLTSAQLLERIGSARVLADTGLGQEGAIEGTTDEMVRVQIVCAEPERAAVVDHRCSCSDAYRAAFEARARERGVEIGDDGVVTLEGVERPVASEEELYRLAGLPLIPVEMREGAADLEEWSGEEPPVEEEQFMGMMHVHSTWSDGRLTIREVVEVVRARGYRWMLLCDHSKAAFYANGLDERRLEEQGREIDAINAELDPAEFRVLKGIECDVLADGAMDFSDDVLASLDAVVASIHSNFALPRERQTERLIRAIENPYVTMLGHPTGRLILKREGYNPDLEAVMVAAARAGKAIEINCNPWRLDLSWHHARRARSLGLTLAVNPDAHTLRDFDFMRHGVTMARKAGLSSKNLLNSLDADTFLAWVRGTRGG